MNDARTQKALTLTLNWLKAVNIPAKAVYGDVHGNDIVITAADGSNLGVALTLSKSQREAVPGQIAVAANKLTLRPDKAIPVFHTITAAAGYGQPMPIDRGAVPTTNLRSGEDFDLTALRHWEFRRTTNDVANDLPRFKDVIDSEIRRFRYINRWLCDQHGYEVGDLTTFAMAWTMNFIGLYENKSLPEADNRKLLRNHLRQRLNEFQVMLRSKGQRIFVTTDVVDIATTGTIPDGNRQSGRGHDILSFVEEEPDIDPDLLSPSDRDAYLQELQSRSELDLETPDTRAASAKKLLGDSLGRLSHGEFISVLTEAATNEHLDIDARREAAKRLNQHERAGDCRPCWVNYRVRTLEIKFHSKKCEITKKMLLELNDLARIRVRKFFDAGGKICPKCKVLRTDYTDYRVFYDFTFYERTHRRLGIGNMKICSYCNSCRHY